MMQPKKIDAVMIGRAGVDLYGDQVGGRLEDMGSFSKYIGGSPTNTAIGAARLGLKTALISRTGEDAMGRFIREELNRERVNTDYLTADPEKMTAMVMLGIKDKQQFPLIFFRENCADMALSEADIHEDLIASARAVVTSGTHFSTPTTKAASMRALALAEKHGAERWIDLDYRPVLWGLANKGDGETRFIADDGVTAHLQSIMPCLDVVVGTEEEFHIAGGAIDTIEALKALRRLTDATFVVKLGPMGCAVFTDAIPSSISNTYVIQGFPIEVFNVLGAGDAFMGGLITGRLEGKSWRDACAMANACGAFAVSRHACAPAYPSRLELDHFLAQGSPHFRLRDDTALEQLHWSTTRQGQWPQVLAFAFDHRSQLEELCTDSAKISAFKQICANAVLAVQDTYPASGLGALCDRRLGLDALSSMTGRGLWLASPVEWPSSRPLSFEGEHSIASYLKDWPREIAVKCLFFAHPDDDEAMWQQQLDRIKELAEACRTWRLELLLEVIPPKQFAITATSVSDCMQRVYNAGVFPDWWKLPAPQKALWSDAWDAIETCIDREDPHCRGVVLLGLAAPKTEIKEAIEKSAKQKWCKGFAVGRSIFDEAAKAWLNDEIDSETAQRLMVDTYQELMAAWKP